MNDTTRPYATLGHLQMQLSDVLLMTYDMGTERLPSSGVDVQGKYNFLYFGLQCIYLNIYF